MKKNLYYFSGMLLLALAQWSLLRNVLSFYGVEGAGLYYLYISILTPFYVLLGGGFRFYSQNQNSVLDDMIRFRWLNMCIILLSSGVLALTTDRITLFLLAFSQKFIDFSLESSQGLKNKTSRDTDTTLISLVIVNLILISSQYFSENLRNANLINIEIVLPIVIIAFAWMMLPKAMLRKFTYTYDVKKLLSVFNKYTYVYASIGIPALIIALIALVPRLSIEFLIDSFALGVFGTYMYLYIIAKIINQSLIVTLISKQIDAYKIINIGVFNALTLGLIAVAVSLFFHEEIISIIFGDKLAEFSYLLPIFLVLFIIESINSTLEYLIVYMQSSVDFLIYNSYLLIMSVLLCPSLIYLFGFDGAIYYLFSLASIKFYIYLKSFLTCYQKARALCENSN
ncbi:hypothetical protein LG272_11035 [Pseudidiomarina marina]|uniref:hypothetical protein n=1 Tax=Pseudidiomarina marina TaxID=502366 RepID=UPI00384B4669